MSTLHVHVTTVPRRPYIHGVFNPVAWCYWGMRVAVWCLVLSALIVWMTLGLIWKGLVWVVDNRIGAANAHYEAKAAVSEPAPVDPAAYDRTHAEVVDSLPARIQADFREPEPGQLYRIPWGSREQWEAVEAFAGDRPVEWRQVR